MLPFKKREMAADDSTFQSSAKAEAYEHSRLFSHNFVVRPKVPKEL